MKSTQLRDIIRSQHGLLTLDEFTESGASRRSWYRALDSHQLVEVFRGVACLPGTPITPTTRIAAAQLSAGRMTTAASHRSTAFLWGLDIVGDDPIDLLRTDRSDGCSLPGVVIHRPRDLVDLRPVMRRGIRCTNPVRALCDLGAEAPGDVERFLVHLRIAGNVSLSAARSAMLRHAERGRHGITALRSAIEKQALLEKPPDSVLEEAMMRLITRYRLPPVTFHARRAGFEVDFAVNESPVVLECVGWEYHGRNKDQFEFDADRTAALSAAGFVVVPFTWMQIVRRAGATATRIRDLVRQWSPDLLSGRDQ
jgi:very-short-patch-repair endonuclease